MAIGKVKWFDPKKGYGFIRPEEGGADVFVHVTALEAADIHLLEDGQTVKYDIISSRGKQAASNLKVI